MYPTTEMPRISERPAFEDTVLGLERVDEASDANAGPGVVLEAVEGGLRQAAGADDECVAKIPAAATEVSEHGTVDASFKDEAGHHQGEKNREHGAGERAGRGVVDQDDQDDPDDGGGFDDLAEFEEE